MTRKSNTSDFITKALAVHSDRYDYSLVEYVNCKSKVRIICKEHGEFQQTPNNHLTGFGCNDCAIETMKSKQSGNTATFVEKARLLHGGYYDYSFSIYKNNRTPVGIICPKHGKFYQTPDKHLAGKGCYKCGRDKCAQNLTKIDILEFVCRSVSVHGHTYDYSRVNVSGGENKVKIRCPHHGYFYQTAFKHMSGQGCPKCAKYGFDTNKIGYLYVLISSDSEFMKIGISNNLPVRLSQLKKKTPFPFDVLKIFKGSGANILALEQSLHKVFVNAKLNGFDGCTEWFKFDTTINLIIK